MSNNFKSSCTLLSKVVTTYTTLVTLRLWKVAKVVTTYTTLVTLRLWKVAKVVQSCIGRFPDVVLVLLPVILVVVLPVIG